jgi:hypothetical protein
MDEIRQNKDFNIQKIEAINELEELGLSSDEDFLMKCSLMLQLGGHNSMRVYGEYDKVSRTTKYPVLMNKATSISLTREGVVELMESLSKVYKKQLESLRMYNFNAKLKKAGGIVPVRFSLTMRSHADPNRFEVNLAKVGDWRLGRNGMFSAELVFHEFAHIIDFGRTSDIKVRKGSARLSEVHREDFVYILDNMLLKYKDWIEERYDSQEHYKQLVELNDRLSDFDRNQKQIISKLAEEEKQERDALAKEQKKKYDEIGMSDNSFPLYAILSENTDTKMNFIDWSLNSFIEEASVPADKSKANDLKDKIGSESKVVLDKDEIALLDRAIKQGRRMNFVRTLDIGNQFTAPPIVKQLEKDIDNLSKGILESHKIPDAKVLVDHYDEDFIIGDEGEMAKIMKLNP